MNRESLGGHHVKNPNCNDYKNFGIQGFSEQAAWEDDVTCPFVMLGVSLGGRVGRRMCFATSPPSYGDGGLRLWVLRISTLVSTAARAD